MVDVRALHTTDGKIINLVTREEYEPWLLLTDGGAGGHPLVLSNDPYERAGIQYNGAKDHPNFPRVIAVDFFIPTSGYSNWSPNGHLFIDHALRPQQLDFLMSFFENWEDLACTFIISFCDESPELGSVLETVYSLMAIYEIPHEKVMFMGHNFAGQEIINTFAKENGEVPLLYIVSWWMIGHCDTEHLEELVSREYYPGHPDQPGAVKEHYTLQPHDMSPKKNTFIFLNRRETKNRMALLYLLWQKGVKHVDSIISAFPPLKLYGLALGRADSSPSEDPSKRNHYTTTYFKSTMTTLVPAIENEFDDVAMHNFKEEMKLGKSLPGDHAFIGDVESKFVPQNNDAYIWLTCESTSELKEKNIFFTEKVLKPMMYGQALVVYAQPGFVKAFKALGFHTLATEFGIDESYDNIVDDAERINFIAEQMIKVGSIPLLQMHEIYLTLEDKIIENNKRMWSMLSNVRHANAFTHNLNRAVLSQVMGTTKSDRMTTAEALELYKDFWDLSIINNK